MGVLLLCILYCVASLASGFQLFSARYNLTGDKSPNCPNATCCASEVYSDDFLRLSSSGVGEYNFTFLSCLPDGYALNNVNISLFGAYNYSGLTDRTFISILIGTYAIQTDYQITDSDNAVCHACNNCHCDSCHHQIDIPSQEHSMWWPFHYQDTNLLRFMITEGEMALSHMVLHFLALDIRPVVHSLLPSGIPINTTRKGFTVYGSNFLGANLHYNCTFKSDKESYSTVAYVYNETTLFCYTDFVSELRVSTLFELTVLPDVKPLGDIYFPPGYGGPIDFYVYVEPRMTNFVPTWGDPSGGTTVTILGEGFVNTSDTFCRFGSAASKAHWINGSALSCVTPKQNVDSQVVVEVSENGMDWVTNNELFSYGGYTPLGPGDWLYEHLWVIVVAALGLVLFISVSILLGLYYFRESTHNNYQRVIAQIGTSALIPRDELDLKERVGRGSFGDVYRGTWRFTEVAIKTIVVPSESLLAELVREAQLMLTMRHPNITQLMGVSVEDDEICIVTEFISRGSLYRILHLPNLQLEFDHVRKFALDCCKGMAYLHASQIMHRDLKCSNLLVDKDWNVKVSDFGLSRSVSEKEQVSVMTACGTPCWAAPEVLRNMSYSYAADVYSFGVCLWEMLTRQYPYEGLPSYHVVIAVATKGLRLQIPASVPESFSEIMEATWLEAEERPSFGDLVTTLSDLPVPPSRLAHPRVKGGGSLILQGSLGSMVKRERGNEKKSPASPGRGVFVPEGFSASKGLQVKPESTEASRLLSMDKSTTSDVTTTFYQ